MALPLSVSICCRNNGATIERTLASVAPLAGEIVAVDSGSTDATLEILARFSASVTRTEWRGFVATKQYALELCTQPWVLCLDSDESLEPALAESLKSLIERNDPGIAAARVNRKIWYRGKPLNHAWQPERRLRLVRKGGARWGGFDPHDKLEVAPGAPGRTVDLAGDLRHDSFATFVEHLAKQVNHSKTAARALLDRGERPRPSRIVWSPIGALFKQLVVKQAWRDGYAGWMAAGTTAAGAIMKHVAMLEMAGEEKKRE